MLCRRQISPSVHACTRCHSVALLRRSSAGVAARAVSLQRTSSRGPRGPRVVRCVVSQKGNEDRDRFVSWTRGPHIKELERRKKRKEDVGKREGVKSWSGWSQSDSRMMKMTSARAPCSCPVWAMMIDAIVYRGVPARLSVSCLPEGFCREMGRSQNVWNRPSFTGFTEGKEWCRGAESNCRHHDFQSMEMSASSDFSVPFTRTIELSAHDGTPRASFLSQIVTHRC